MFVLPSLRVLTSNRNKREHRKLKKIERKGNVLRWIKGGDILLKDTVPLKENKLTG
jgi:hypothetical protein